MYIVKKEEMQELRKGFNIKEIANKLEINEKYVYAILSGARKCSKKIAVLLVIAMGEKMENVEKYFTKI